MLTNSFRFLNEEANSRLTEEFRKNDIPFLTDGETIFYLKKDVRFAEAAACRVRNWLCRESFYPWQIVCFPQGWETSYREYMSSNQVPYFEEYIDGELCFLVALSEDVHEWAINPPPVKLPKYTSRKCSTLGTYFRDVYKDGKLFAVQVPKEVAHFFTRRPYLFHGNVEASIQKFRTWQMEAEYRQAMKGGYGTG